MNNAHYQEVAFRKAGVREGWDVVGWERIDDSNDCVFTVAERTGQITRGPRKGRAKYEGGRKRAAVTETEAQTECDRYERETGNCGECMGTKQVWAGWSKATGHRVCPCRKCNETGKAGLIA